MKKRISNQELNETYKTLLDNVTMASTQTNVYDYYLNTIREKQSRNGLDSTEIYEKHHIVPRFEKGTDMENNIILLTVKEHVVAHWLRYKVLQKTQNLATYLFRVGDTVEAISLRHKHVMEVRERDRAEKRYFFCTNFQTNMGKRGGPLGGSANTDTQFEARQKVGCQFGRNTGMANQGNFLKNFLSNWSIWAFSEKAFSTPRTKDRGKEFYNKSKRKFCGSF